MAEAIAGDVIIPHFDHELGAQRLPFRRPRRAPAAGTAWRVTREAWRRDQLFQAFGKGRLFSVRKGLFFWTPLLLLAVAGVPFLRRLAPPLFIATVAYLPYCFFNLLSPLISLIYGITGFRIERIEPAIATVTEGATS